MNDVLRLRGHFEQMNRTSAYGRPTLAIGKSVSHEKTRHLKKDLSAALAFWEKHQSLIDGALIEINYDDVVPKSGRAKKLLVGFKSGDDIDSNHVVGARFADVKHVITYYITLDQLRDAISRVEKIADVLEHGFDGFIDCKKIDKVYKNQNIGRLADLTRNQFIQNVVDMSRIEKITVPDNSKLLLQRSNDKVRIVSIFNAGITIKELFSKISDDRNKSITMVDDYTALLGGSDMDLLVDKAPNLIAMSVVDMDCLSLEEGKEAADNGLMSIPNPKDEPVIGVIDTGFDREAYFSRWVEYDGSFASGLGLNDENNEHGTAVSSIIVDGPTLNEGLDDGCGRFRVRFFAVGNGRRISVVSLAKNIKEIVENNLDIKVWNLCLGTDSEIEENYISPVAAILDELQFEHEILFVVSGTNIPDSVEGDDVEMRIGSPADSINSLVVNAVDYEKMPASYTRKGKVLSFFVKPDVCYYGGEKSKDDYIQVCTGKNKLTVRCGTSFAAPWIARKAAYLIYVMGLSREVAKALIIDAACGWDTEYKDDDVATKKGFGVVPIRINDILKTNRDEIKFVMSGTSEKYDTFTYRIPVPLDENGFPYVAKATMCYFPKCSRDQGVDYSNTELDITFGRLDNEGHIRSINNNTQSVENAAPSSWVREREARKLFRKWDNTKHIQQKASQNARSKKIYARQEWGLSIKTKERLSVKYGENLNFGVVITLKEINGVNRIEDFIRMCLLHGWLVNRINVDAQVDIYNRMQADIDFNES